VVPKGLFAAEPWWRNMFENALTVQFNHRNLAYVIAVLAVVQAYVTRSSGSLMLFAAVLAQVALGVWTLLWAVPLWLGLAHQGGALVVLAAAIWNLHCELKSEQLEALRMVRAS
jgi:heme a synthase